MSEIKTYPEMNINIKQILRIGDDPVSLYAAQRIEELENLLTTHEPHGHNVTNQQYTDLLDRVKTLEKALQFYADKKYYYITDTFEPSQALSWTVQKDKGEKARSVLDGDTSCTDAQD